MYLRDSLCLIEAIYESIFHARLRKVLAIMGAPEAIADLLEKLCGTLLKVSRVSYQKIKIALIQHERI